MHGREVFVVDAVRTPVGRFGGAFAKVRPDDLGAVVIKALLERTPTLDPARIGEVYFGAANQAGEDNRNVARMSSLLAGLPTSVPGSTVNRLCASGLDAVVAAARTIAVGDASIMVAGGVESMTRAPYVLPKPERAFPAGNPSCISTTLGLADGQPGDARGVDGQPRREHRAARREVRRRPARPPTRSPSAATSGPRRPGPTARTTPRVVQVPGAELERDEGIRDGVTHGVAGRAQAGLPRRRHGHRRQRLASSPTARPRCCSPTRTESPSSASSRWPGSPPPASTRSTRSSSASVPVQAVNRALAKAGRSHADVTTMELNEAFAAQSLACLSEWPDLDRDRRQPARRGHRDRPPPRAARAPGWPARSPTSSPRPAPGSASRRCASASGRAWP